MCKAWVGPYQLHSCMYCFYLQRTFDVVLLVLPQSQRLKNLSKKVTE